MESDLAVTVLSALAHDGRLAAFRLLVEAGVDGMAAGEIARRLGVPPNSLSANLAVLSHAGLVASRRAGRWVIYRADYDRMAALLGYLVRDCCGGAPEVCVPLAGVVARAARCAAPVAGAAG